MTTTQHFTFSFFTENIAIICHAGDIQIELDYNINNIHFYVHDTVENYQK